jgi:hypothetical protein
MATVQGSAFAGSAANAVAVTPSDVTVLIPTIGVYVGGAGNVAVTMLNGAVVTFTAPPVGTVLPIQVTKVMATNTTATLIIALW